MKAEPPTTLPDPSDRPPGPGPGANQGGGSPAADALAEARLAAEAAGRAKREFLNNMNHEFRTPLNAIIGMIGLVLGSELTTDQRECLEVATRSANDLLALLEAFLDFSRIEAGRLELESAPFDPRSLFADALGPLSARAREKGLGWAVELDPALPPVVVGDPLRLRQVVINLVDNAVKFTDRGRVCVRVGIDPDRSAPGEAPLRFEVADTGIGVRPEAREAIFRAFEQADGSTTRRHGGVGLGLTLAARLVRSMGGTIALESEAGRGSTFRFTAKLGDP